MTVLTVIMANYLRPRNMQRALDALCKQSVQSRIFVWDNSPTQDFHDSRVSWILRSSKNARCAPRWWLASHADTDFVLIHDDDLMPSHPNVLAWTVDAAIKAAPFAVGAAGVILQRDLGYWQAKHVGLRAADSRHDMQVDIVKGCYFCCPTARLTDIGYLHLDAEDDIAVSARLGKGLRQPHQVLARLQQSFEFLPEGVEARKRRASHRSAREAARRVQKPVSRMYECTYPMGWTPSMASMCQGRGVINHYEGASMAEEGVDCRGEPGAGGGDERDCVALRPASQPAL
jgi:hypothetical protein